MTKAKKIILIVCLAVVALIVLAYLSVVIYYQCSYYKVNGFEMVNSMIYLTVTDKDYVDLGGERYILKTGYAESFVTNEFDSFVSNYMLNNVDEKYRHNDVYYLKGLVATKNGIQYEYKYNPFGDNRFVLMRGEPLE